MPRAAQELARAEVDAEYGVVQQRSAARAEVEAEEVGRRWWLFSGRHTPGGKQGGSGAVCDLLLLLLLFPSPPPPPTSPPLHVRLPAHLDCTPLHLRLPAHLDYALPTSSFLHMMFCDVKACSSFQRMTACTVLYCTVMP